MRIAASPVVPMPSAGTEEPQCGSYLAATTDQPAGPRRTIIESPAAAGNGAGKRAARGAVAQTGTVGKSVDGDVTAAQLTATGEILKGFLATGSGQRLMPDELVALTSSLRAALA